MHWRAGIAVIVLAASLGLVAWAVDRPAEVQAGTHWITIEAGGDTWFAGDVQARGTPYDVLLAAATGRFDVESTGRGDTVFVTAIDGIRNQGAAGWCFSVGVGEDWTYPQVGAGSYALQPGERVRWSYEDAGCP